VLEVAYAAIDDAADAALALEVGQHHLAEDAAAAIAARIDHHHVARLRMVEHVAVELQLRVVVLAGPEHVLALGHELQGERRPRGRAAIVPLHGADDVRIADTEPLQRAADGGGADFLQALRPVRRRANDVGGLDHAGTSFCNWSDMRDQPLVAPAVSPPTKRRWKARKRMTTGSVITIEAAMTPPQSVLNSVENSASPIGSVLTDWS